VSGRENRTVTPVSVTRPADVPAAPGVYEFADATGRVLYVGKAKNLSQRLGSYFPGGAGGGDLHPRTRRMLGNATTVRWVVCASETEALVLEREWIRAKQPPYNVRLRAGDGYAGVALTRGTIPRLTTWRGRRPAGTETFGPYPGTATGDLVDALTVLFGVRTCDDTAYRQAERRGRACLLGETGKCLAPCVGRVDTAAHAAAADDLRRNLADPDPALGERLEAEMLTHSAAGNFEAAARRRDQLAAFRSLARRQRVSSAPVDLDAIAVARGGERVAVARVAVRGGVVTEVEQYAAVDDPSLDAVELLAVVVDLLPGRGDTPKLVAAAAVPGARTPGGEHERAVLSFAGSQAEEALVSTPLRRDDPAAAAEAGAEIAALLGIPGPVRRIECTDISHTGGRHTVGAVVTLVDGLPRTDLYRRLDLGDLGGDDYAATRTLVARRLRPGGMGHDTLPDLLLIDGGPGQVAAAVAGRADAALAAGDETPLRVPIAGLAKRFEEIWPEDASVPLRPAASSPAGLLLRHARDEAHRHALGGNRRRRERAAVRTRLEDVPGLGPVRRRALLERFGTLDAVASAPADELAEVRGIGPALARRIHETLAGAGTASMTP